MNYYRQPNETDFDYIVRLVEGKSNGIYDIDYTELFKLAFGVDLAMDECRKRYYGIKMLLPYLGQKNLTPDFDVKKIELQKEKEKIQTLRMDLNRIIRESSRTELLYEEFIKAVKDVYSLPLPEFKPLLNQSYNKKYILSFADSHFGKEFRSITNEYSLEIAYERFNRLLSEVIDLVEENNINHLTVLALGDMIEGMCLRASQLQHLKIGIVQQTIQFMRYMVSWLNTLSEYVEITYYQVPYANHSQIRPFGTKANEFASEDMEKIIFTYINDVLANNPRIKVVECEDKHIIFNIFNYTVIASHGHDIRDINSFLKDVSNKYRIFFDYGFFAHKHSSGTKAVNEGLTNNCEIINVPSIMGTDDYADSLLVGSKAGATLIEFTERQGKRKTYDIILN